MNREIAETLGLEALQFVVADDQELSAFTAQTGMGLDDLRTGAADPQSLGTVLGALLDFVLAEERRVLAFCEAFGLEPDQPGRARLALPGATAGIWE